jgi:hypothetical protein
MILAVVTAVAWGSAAHAATAIYFIEREKDGEPARTRMIVTNDFLRIDEGGPENVFILFNRRTQTIFSVNALGGRTLAMPPKKVTAKPPLALVHKVKTDSMSFPAIASAKVTHYTLTTNGETCAELFAAKDLLPAVTLALREYHEALAGYQAVTLDSTPKEFQSVCDMASNVFHPVGHLVHGFPIRLTDFTGKTRELVDYQLNFTAGAELFELPKGMRAMTMDELRGK